MLAALNQGDVISTKDRLTRVASQLREHVQSGKCPSWLSETVLNCVIELDRLASDSDSMDALREIVRGETLVEILRSPK